MRTNKDRILSENDFLVIKLTSYSRSETARKGGTAGASAGMYQDEY